MYFPPQSIRESESRIRSPILGPRQIPGKNEFSAFLVLRNTFGQVLVERLLPPPFEVLKVANLRKVIRFESNLQWM